MSLRHLVWMISASAAHTPPRLPSTIAAGRVAVCTAGIQLCYRLAGKASRRSAAGPDRSRRRSSESRRGDPAFRPGRKRRITSPEMSVPSDSVFACPGTGCSHPRPGSGAAGPLRPRPVRVEPGRGAAFSMAPGAAGPAGLPGAVPAAHRRAADNRWLAAGFQTVQQQALRDFARAMTAFFASTGETYEALVDGQGICLLAAGNVPLIALEGVITRPVRGISPSQLALAWRTGDHRPLILDYVRAVRQAARQTDEAPSAPSRTSPSPSAPSSTRTTTAAALSSGPKTPTN